jgi:hypothetical protein
MGVCMLSSCRIGQIENEQVGLETHKQGNGRRLVLDSCRGRSPGRRRPVSPRFPTPRSPSTKFWVGILHRSAIYLNGRSNCTFPQDTRCRPDWPPTTSPLTYTPGHPSTLSPVQYTSIRAVIRSRPFFHRRTHEHFWASRSLLYHRERICRSVCRSWCLWDNAWLPQACNGKGCVDGT